MLVQELGQFDRVAQVSFHAQREGVEANQGQERMHGGLVRSEIDVNLAPHLVDEGQFTLFPFHQ